MSLRWNLNVASFLARLVAMSLSVLSRSALKMLEASPTRMMAPAPCGESIILFEFSRARMRAFFGMMPEWQAPMAPMKPTSSARVKRSLTSGPSLTLPVTSSKVARAMATAARSSHAVVERTPLAILGAGRSHGMMSFTFALCGCLKVAVIVLKCCFLVG